MSKNAKIIEFHSDGMGSTRYYVHFDPLDGVFVLQGEDVAETFAITKTDLEDVLNLVDEETRTVEHISVDDCMANVNNNSIRLSQHEDQLKVHNNLVRCMAQNINDLEESLNLVRCMAQDINDLEESL